MWTNFPAPQPDEFWASFVARARAANGETSATDLGAVMVKAMNAGVIHPSEVITNHTNLGYARLVSKAHAGRPVHRHIDAYGSPSVFQLGLSTGVVRCCPACHRDDLSRAGTSYWRRSHQLPGLVLCPTHDTPLIELPRVCMSKVECLFNSLEARDPPESWEKWAANPVIQRFVALSYRALRCRASVDPANMSNALKRRALAIGLSLSECGERTRLSDWMRDRLPHGWVAATFPSVLERQARQPVHMVDGIFRMQHAAYRTASYLIAMALLWEDPEEAFAACTEHPDPLNATRQINAGHIALNAVLAGQSVRAACKATKARLVDFEEALRARLGDANALSQRSEQPAASSPLLLSVQTKEVTMGLLAELEGR